MFGVVSRCFRWCIGRTRMPRCSYCCIGRSLISWRFNLTLEDTKFLVVVSRFKVIKKYKMYSKCIKEYQVYQEILDVSSVYQVYQMYISNKSICDILYLLYVGWILFLPFLQTINMRSMNLIIITCFAFLASAPNINSLKHGIFFSQIFKLPTHIYVRKI